MSVVHTVKKVIVGAGVLTGLVGACGLGGRGSDTADADIKPGLALIALGAGAVVIFRKTAVEMYNGLTREAELDMNEDILSEAMKNNPPKPRNTFRNSGPSV